MSSDELHNSYRSSNLHQSTSSNGYSDNININGVCVSVGCNTTTSTSRRKSSSSSSSEFCFLILKMVFGAATKGVNTLNLIFIHFSSSSITTSSSPRAK